MAIGICIIAWELVGSLLLSIRRCQVFVVPVALMVHAALALVGFADFGGLAFALLVLFVPADYYRMLTESRQVRLLGMSVSRVQLYFAINIFGGLLSGIDVHLRPFLHGPLVVGILFNLAVLVFVWPIVSTLFADPPRPRWSGMPVFTREQPIICYALPLLLLLFGFTSYLGLRTAGNFSMFSNLRTEGATSNHLLLGSNPLKVWGYQDDVVRITALDPKYGTVLHNFEQFTPGYELPALQFRTWIHEWHDAGLRVPLTYEYRGRTYSTADIVTDPVWRTDTRTWQMVLMEFRVIQPAGPNGCRW
jgi:hypothetical protein